MLNRLHNLFLDLAFAWARTKAAPKLPSGQVNEAEYMQEAAADATAECTRAGQISP